MRLLREAAHVLRMTMHVASRLCMCGLVELVAGSCVCVCTGYEDPPHVLIVEHWS